MILWIHTDLETKVLECRAQIPCNHRCSWRVLGVWISRPFLGRGFFMVLGQGIDCSFSETVEQTRNGLFQDLQA